MQAQATTVRRLARRGNTIVLVTAILVLLVIIATAFVSRTNSVRNTSAAQQASAGRDGRGESIGVNVAREVGDALFARPVDTADPFVRTDNSVNPPVAVASSSWPRFAPPLGAQRYSIDQDVIPAASAANPISGDGFPDFAYNAAPYETKPWTNWPDSFGGGAPWPFGPGAPNGALVDGGGNPIGDGNPYGNPGFGDSRWLRSTEPERVGVDQNGDFVPDYFTFSHWSHLSWLPTANNGWRVVEDISDITSSTIDNLGETATLATGRFAVALPYEQWLPGVFPAGVANAGDFITRRQNWFNNYSVAYSDPLQALPNFFSLRALGKPSDEYRAGSFRNVVSRTFTDTDGDGFTDSFWFLSPTGVDRGIRTVVGVSVVDNSALLNANVATKFSFENTAGHTPADLALVTSVTEFPPLNNNGSTVGFFDGPVNQPSTNATQIPAGPALPSPLPSWWGGDPALELSFPQGNPRFDRTRFGDENPSTRPLTFLHAIGMRTPTGGSDPGSPADGFPLIDGTLPANVVRGAFESAIERQSYFKVAGIDPEQPLFGLTPFDSADEFELRAYHGNNFPNVLSRFEQAINIFSPNITGDDANSFQFLRSSPQREESDEYLDQLSARQLLVDNRRKLTMFNGARNETMPPWLWPSPYYEETRNYLNPGGPVPAIADPNYAAFQDANEAEYARQKQKIDLRRPMFVDANGAPQLVRNPFLALQWRNDMIRVLEQSLARNPAPGVFESYYGPTDRDYRRTRSMVASLAANLDTASDEPQTLGTSGVAIDRPLYPSAPQQDPPGYFPPTTDAVPDPYNTNQFYLGLEKQPFITEVFFGIVYPKSDFNENEWNQQITAAGNAPTVPPSTSLPTGPNGVDDGGENFVDSTSPPTAIIAVQIANPYDTPVSLGDFRIQCFGQTYSFAVGGLAAGYGPNPVLPPATLGKPSTAIVFAVANGVVGDYATGDFKKAVLDFFDIEKGEWTGSNLVQEDRDSDGLIEYATLYDARGNLNSSPAADPQDRTLVFDATGSWNVNLQWPNGSNNTTYNTTTGQPVQLLRNITPPPGVGGGPISILVDRFDNSLTGPEVNFAEEMNRLFTDAQFIPPEKRYVYDVDQSRRYIAGVRIKDNDFYMTWCRASRVWAWDVDTWDQPTVSLDDKVISATELSPRYVFSMATAPVRAERQWEGVANNGARQSGPQGYKGDCWKVGQDPDGDLTGAGRWANFVFVDAYGRTLRGKPVFFTNLVVLAENGTEVISSPGGVDPMPFLPALGLPDGNVGFRFSEARGAVEFQGATYEWMTGNKGCRAADWARFNDVETARIPFQMTQRDTDFEQIGEVLDVFLWGHVFQNWGNNPTTLRTFSEIMLDDDPDSEFYPGEGVWVNRLHIRLPGELANDDPGVAILGSRFDAASTTVPPTPKAGYAAYQPALPAGVGFLEALTIDGPGRNSFDRNANSAYEQVALGNANTDAALAETRRFRLASGFGGGLTPGLVNLNTALPETLQAMPLLTRLPKTGQGSPYSQLPTAIRAYRDRDPAIASGGQFLASAPGVVSMDAWPSYADRGLTPPQVTSSGIVSSFPNGQPRFFPGMRNERGFATIGELALLARPAADGPFPGARNAYSVRWLGVDPYVDFSSGSFGDYTTGYAWSTDRTNSRPRQLPADILNGIGAPTNVPLKAIDEPLGDVEDLNLLFKGISNLVTTRSDVFTVYLRVRQVKQNPVTGLWDGTNRDLIVDDSRYVMGIDRSNVNSPGGMPKILYFQKCPN